MWKVVQSVAGICKVWFVLQSVTSIAKCDRYCKVWQVLQSVAVITKCGKFIVKCVKVWILAQKHKIICMADAIFGKVLLYFESSSLLL